MPGMTEGVGAAASWVGDMVGKLIYVKARKRGVNQRGNGKLLPDRPKMCNSNEMDGPDGMQDMWDAGVAAALSLG